MQMQMQMHIEYRRASFTGILLKGFFFMPIEDRLTAYLTPTHSLC